MNNYIPNIHLKDLFLGNSDGKIEATKNNFDNFFYTNNNKYKQILSKNSFLLTGRKGCGKTLLAYFIKKQSEKDKHWICDIRDLNDFNLQKLIDFDYTELTEREFSLFWQWVIFLELSNCLLKIHPIKSRLLFSSENKLNKFIKDIYKLNEHSPYKFTEMVTNDAFNEEAYAEASTTLFNFNMKGNASKGIKRKYIKNSYYNNLKSLKYLFINALDPKYNITLIYDDLDDVNIKINNNNNYTLLLKSLLQAVNNINSTIRMTTNNKTKIIILLRSDIVEMLHKNSANLNKITSDCQVELNWMKAKNCYSYNHPLMDLILTKITASLNLDIKNEYNKQDLYELLFPEKIEGKKAIDYLLEYSFGRPRDVIKYLNIIIKNYPDASCFKAKYFNDCKLEYSNWFYYELQNELSIYEDPCYISEIFQLLSNFNRVNFDYKTIYQFFIRNKSQYSHINSIDYTLKFLYKFGILGNSWPKRINYKRNLCRHKRASDFYYSWYYKNNCEYACDFNKEFVIHKALRKKLLL